MNVNLQETKQQIHSLSEVPGRLLRLFFALYVIHPAAYFLLVATILGIDNFLRVGRIILILAPPIIISFTLIYFFMYRRLAARTAALLGGPSPEELREIEAFIDTYSFRSSLPLFIGCAGGPVLTGIIGYVTGVVYSLQLVFFIVLIGEVTAFIVAYIQYYYSKMYLYPVNLVIRFRPLSVFHKFSTPILTSVLVMIALMSVGIFKIIEGDMIQARTRQLSHAAEETAGSVNSFITRTIARLKTYAGDDAVREMNRDAIERRLGRWHETKPEEIEMLFVAFPDGTAPNSFGDRTANVSQRSYFKTIFGERRDSAISEVLTSKASKRDITVIAVPVRRGNDVVGLMGATVLFETMQIGARARGSSAESDLLIVDSEGTIIYYKNRDLLRKVIGRDITGGDNGFMNVEAVLAGEDHVVPIAFEGRNRLAYVKRIAANDSRIVMMMDRGDVYSSINYTLLMISISFLIMTLGIYYIILRIARQLSRPIGNIIGVFKRVSEGDLTASSDDYIPDSFGELVRYLQILLTKLNGVLVAALESSRRLSESSTGLWDTSRRLSENTQEQASSIEEMTASLEETTSSIDMISTSTRDQARTASTTFESMQQLKSIIQTIGESAVQALEMATLTSSEAVKGNELMQRAIQGMESIDASTQKITEFVGMISDISDQVNLLALNAAIEAARAGEHGRGFAVVADEISKLADQTSAGAKNISSLIGSGRDQVVQGKGFVDSTSRSLNAIIESIRSTDELVRRIAEMSRSQTEASDVVLAETKKVMDVSGNISLAMQEQTQANKEMTNTINSINESTQSMASESSEMAIAAEEINAQAEILYRGISFFTVKGE
ncbi:MAG: methyl-accepting chemotaxis protein [Spirochaetes bacterium]|nr:methyl-accepting chemotaxis protein [Spirochaetota bacterium]